MTLPFWGSTATRPVWVKKMAWCTPRMSASTGVAWVILSSSPFHKTLPVFLSRPMRPWPLPPPASRRTLPSITGEAAFSHLSCTPSLSFITSCFQISLPVTASKQKTPSMESIAYTLRLSAGPSTTGVERAPSPPLLSFVPESPPPSYLGTTLRGLLHISLPVFSSRQVSISPLLPSLSPVTSVYTLPPDSAKELKPRFVGDFQTCLRLHLALATAGTMPLPAGPRKAPQSGDSAEKVVVAMARPRTVVR